MSARRTLQAGICSALIVGLVLAGCGSAPSTQEPSVPPVVASPEPSRAATRSPEPTRSPAPLPPASPSAPPPTSPSGIADLTGMAVDPAVAHRLPLAVMIDDNRIARPQSGFNQASVIYQAPADGGETRYMFVFQEGDSAQVGPVRSARVYFVHWASEVKAAIAHYGGDVRSLQVLDAFDRARFTDVDALFGAGKAYHRVSSRKAPHNAYTSTTALRAMARKLGAPETEPADLYRRTFVAPSDPASLPKSQRITIPYRTGVVEYRFDRAGGVYRRSLDGKAQIDPDGGKVVTTRNVVVLFMSFRTDTKIEPGHSRPVIGSLGTGRALIFREGRMVEGSWSKRDEAAPTRLLDPAGNEVPLVTGRTFFQIVPIGTKVGHGS